MTRRYYMPEVDGESPCAMCTHSAPSGGECIACSSLCSTKGKKRSGPRLREWWLTHVKKAEIPESEAMRRGRREHERIERDRGVTRDLDEVLEALSKVGGKVTWSARLCSRYLGIRGKPDMIESERVAPDRIKHLITEVKSHPNKRKSYWNQAVGYGLIMSYRQMLANGVPFYDELPISQSYSVDIDFKFHYYDSDFEPDSFPLVRDWKFVSEGEGGRWPDGTPYGAEYIFGFKKTRRKFSGIRNVKRLSSLPKCAWCPPVDSPKSTLNDGDTLPRDLCWAWREYCSNDLPKKNHKQMNLKAWENNGFEREKTLDSGEVVKVFDTGKRAPGRENHPGQYAVSIDGEIVDSAPRKSEILRSFKEICREAQGRR